ncbi:Histidine kinase-, DNA gyrase B-, and HSP90-like ATPase, partial [Streptomyces sp. DvalAA-14]|uniref:sensor histidine kinase n=1 Tax=unclassified Streptomyces TaxID=2593676 RepID=UPI00081B0E90
ITAPTPGVQLAVYRIVQESLTNALKYAGPATGLLVTLRVTPDTVHLEVRDTGPGDSAAPAAPDGNGLGLIGIRERAVLSGGTATAGPRPGGGWSVAATLPLDPVASDDPPALFAPVASAVASDDPPDPLAPVASDDPLAPVAPLAPPARQEERS